MAVESKFLRDNTSPFIPVLFERKNELTTRLKMAMVNDEFDYSPLTTPVDYTASYIKVLQP